MATKHAPTSINAAIYTRISADPTGQAAGVTRQLEDCHALARRLGWSVAEVYTDNDRSAYSGVRPGFESLLDALKRGQFDAVICWHPDRLYRRLRDLTRLLDVAAGVDIRTVNGGDLDLSTSTGRMLAGIIGSVSQQEVEHKGERRRRANAQRRANGAWNREGRVLFGYTRDGELMPDQAAALRQAATDVLAGVSLRSIAVDWNDRGLLTAFGKRWTNLTLKRMLVNPIYAGLVTYGGEVMEGVTGQWEALWDNDTHHALVALLSNPDRRPGHNRVAFARVYMGSGIFRCGSCGSRIYAGKPGGARQTYYVCRTRECPRKVGRRVDLVDAYVETVALKLLRRSDIHKRLTAAEGIDTDALRAKRKGLVAQKDKLATLLMQGVLTEAGVRLESGKLSEQIESVDRVLADAVRTSPAAALLADGVDKLGEHWAAASADVRGRVIMELMDVTVLPVPQGVKGTVTDMATGERIVNTDYVSITPN